MAFAGELNVIDADAHVHFTPSTLTLEPSSLVTHSSAPSGVNTMRRGRLPTAMFLTISPLAVSTTWTMLATSEVT